MGQGRSLRRSPRAERAVLVRPLDGSAPAEVALVARRMRLTSTRVVLGEATGGSMYTPAWLEARVLRCWRPANVKGRLVALARQVRGSFAMHPLTRSHSRGRADPARARCQSQRRGCRRAPTSVASCFVPYARAASGGLGVRTGSPCAHPGGALASIAAASNPIPYWDDRCGTSRKVFRRTSTPLPTSQPVKTPGSPPAVAL